MAALSSDSSPKASHLCFAQLRQQPLCHLQGCLTLRPEPDRLINLFISPVPLWLARAAPLRYSLAPARSPAPEHRQRVVLLPFSL